MTTMSHAHGRGADWYDTARLRERIDRLVPLAKAALDKDHWTMGVHDQRAFPPGVTHMVNARRLYSKPYGDDRAIWLTSDGTLIDNDGHQVILSRYEMEVLVVVEGALERFLDFDKVKVTAYQPRSTYPSPPRRPQRRGFWQRFWDFIF